jgi:hypothetical protein
MKEFKTKTYKVDQQQYWKDYEYWQVKEKLKKIDEITKGKLNTELDESKIYEIQSLTNSLNRIL